MSIKRFSECALLVAIIIAVVITTIAAFTPIGTEGYYNEDNLYAYISEGWSYVDEFGEITTVSLPVSIKSEQGNTVVLSRLLPEAVPSDGILQLNTGHQDFKVFIDGVEKNVEGVYKNRTFNANYITIWASVDIPADSANKLIELHVQAPDGEVLLSDAVLTTRNALTTRVLKENVTILVLFVMMSIMALLLVLMATLIGTKYHEVDIRGFYFLAAFILLASSWLITDSEIMRVLVVYNDAYYFANFFCFMLMPISFLLFFRGICEHGKKYVTTLIAAQLASFILCTLLMVTGTVQLLDSLIITHILIIISVIIVVALVVIEKFHYKNTKIREIYLSMIVFAVMIPVSLLLYYLNTGIPYSSFFGISLFVFVVLLTSGIIRRAVTVVSVANGFEELTYHTPCGICRLKNDEDFTILYANNYFYGIFALNAEHIKNKTHKCLADMTEPEELERLKQTINSNTGEDFEVEMKQKRVDGIEIFVLARCNITPDTGEITASVIDITDRKQMEEELRVREEEYRIASQQSEKWILRYDIIRRRVSLQTDSAEYLGLPMYLDNMPYSMIEHGTVAYESIEDYLEFFNDMNEGKPEGSAMFLLKNAAGEYLWYRNDYTLVFDNAGKPLQSVISYYDATELREMELAYQKWKQTIEDLPQESISLVEYNLTKDVFMLKSGGLCLLPANLVQINNFNDITASMVEQVVFSEDGDLYSNEVNRERLISAYKHGSRESKLEFRALVNGEYRWISLELQMVAYSDSSDIKLYLLFRDVNEQKGAELLMQQRSQTDSLTGAYNRVTFIERFYELLHNTVGEKHAIVMMDIDNFKCVNDTLGHIYGDNVLRDTVAIIRSVTRDEDIIGRIGGDEFIICMRGIPDRKTLIERMEMFIAKMQRTLPESVPCTVSIGVTYFSDSGKEDFVQLYDKADIALYRAKNTGKNKFVIFTEEMSNEKRHSELGEIE